MRLGGWLFVPGLPEPEYRALQTLCRRHGATQRELLGISIRILARLESGTGDAEVEWPNDEFGSVVSNYDSVMASPQGLNTVTLGDRSVSPHQDSASQGEFRGTSRLMGRRLAPVVERTRDRALSGGTGLLRTSLRGGRPPLSPDERRRRARERKRRWRAGDSGKVATIGTAVPAVSC